MAISQSVGFMVAVLQLQYMLSHGTRTQGGLRINAVTCPDGFQCEPADCMVENSNREKGLDCACADGYVGHITWVGSVTEGKCELAQLNPSASLALCNVENSNREPGSACACLQSFSGTIKWDGSNHEGSCTPAACTVKNSNGEPGPDCRCDEYSSGEISWNGDQVTGTCEDIEFDFGSLFDTQGLLVLGHNKYKCCTHSQTKTSNVVDLQNLDRYKPARILGSKDGCGYLFGDHWHSSGDQKSAGVCKGTLGNLAMITGDRKALKQLLRDKAIQMQKSPNTDSSVKDIISSSIHEHESE